MSYSHNQRRKKIRQFKKKFKENWYPEFRKYVDELVRKRLGPPICTLQDIINNQNK